MRDARDVAIARLRARVAAGQRCAARTSTMRREARSIRAPTGSISCTGQATPLTPGTLTDQARIRQPGDPEERLPISARTLDQPGIDISNMLGSAPK